VKRLKVPIALAIALVAIGWLVVRGVAKNDVYMATLDQWEPERARRETVRLMGFVKEGSIHQDPDRLVTGFVLRNEKGTREIEVSYAGVTPGLFRDGTSVVAAGRLREDGILGATELMTKCPSKYEGQKSPHGDKASAAPSPPRTTDDRPVGG
jgi:cytochrome c-type biogenesis protein CcmE